MTVFYSIYHDGHRGYSAITWLQDEIYPDADISYWVVPGTIDMEDQNV
jgi:hypothetical protein